MASNNAFSDTTVTLSQKISDYKAIVITCEINGLGIISSSIVPTEVFVTKKYVSTPTNRLYNEQLALSMCWYLSDSSIKLYNTYSDTTYNNRIYGIK